MPFISLLSFGFEDCDEGTFGQWLYFRRVLFCAWPTDLVAILSIIYPLKNILISFVAREKRKTVDREQRS